MGKVVPFIGPSDAKYYLAGEAPGENEVRIGRPFVGGAGTLLDKMLMNTGLVREEIRIGNVMRTRPPSNKFIHFYQDKSFRYPTKELEEGRAYLVEDVKRVKPNVFIALGNEPLMTAMGHRGITNWRGSVLWSKVMQCKVVPTIHPAALLRNWDAMPLALFDFRRAREEGRSKEYNIPNRTLVIEPDFVTVMHELTRLEKGEYLSFDVETDEVGCITCIQLSDNPFWSISIPFTRNNGASYWILEQEAKIWERLRDLMESEKVKKIAQNAQFDVIMCRINPWHIKVANLWFDTMCGHHTIYPEIAAAEREESGKRRSGGGKSLGVLCSLYTRQPYYKHLAQSGDDRTFWKYGGLDACVTYESAFAELKEMEEFGVKDFYFENVHPLLSTLIKMQMRGVRINQDVRLEAQLHYKEELDKCVGEMRKIVGRDINVNSPLQLKQLLYDEMGFPAQYKRGTKKVTTDEEALEKLSKKFKHPIFKLILDMRGHNKILSTYLTDKGGEDGRMRCSYVIGGTETGRLSSRASVFGSGANLQNIPKGVCRKMFVPDEGMLFVGSDLSQAEARVVAYLAEEERLIEIFKIGGDIHKQTASWVFSKKVEDVSHEEREMAKRLVHASNYGIGPRNFAYRARCSETEATLLLAKYFYVFPAIKAWHMRVQAHLRRCRTIETPMGRKRTFFGRWGDSLFREAYAYVPQSVVGDVVNKAIIRLCEKYAETQMMFQIHDEYVIQCKREEVERWCERINWSFEIDIPIGRHVVRIPNEIKVGENWDEMKKRGE